MKNITIASEPEGRENDDRHLSAYVGREGSSVHPCICKGKEEDFDGKRDYSTPNEDHVATVNTYARDIIVATEFMRGMSFVDQSKMRALYAYAAKVELDAQGRILLPQNLREHAKLMKNVTVVGVNNHAELWSSDVWDATCADESSPENIAAVMEELHF